MRNVAFLTRPTRGGRKSRSKFSPLGTPLATVSQSSGIKIFGFYQEDYRGHDSQYRHLSIKYCPGPVSIYVCNVEHSGGFADLEIGNSLNVSVYGLKSEGNNHAAYIHNSEDILIAGYGGNASALPGTALFLLENCRNLNIASLTDSPNIAKKKSQKTKIFGRFFPPSSWQMIHDLREIKYLTPNYARPLLYSIKVE
jgi:hypothetical protein